MKKTFIFSLSIVSFAIAGGIMLFIFMVRQKNTIQTSIDDLHNNNQNISTKYNKLFKIGDVEILVEIAKTQQQKKQGLSGRINLPEGTGMIFPFDPPIIVSFWMPDMNFPIDIVYIRNNVVVQVFSNVPNYPADINKDNLPRYISDQPVDLVLEVPAGFMKSHHLGVGSTINYLP